MKKHLTFGLFFVLVSVLAYSALYFVLTPKPQIVTLPNGQQVVESLEGEDFVQRPVNELGEMEKITAQNILIGGIALIEIYILVLFASRTEEKEPSEIESSCS